MGRDLIIGLTAFKSVILMIGWHDGKPMPQRQCRMLLIRIWIALQATCYLSAVADEDFTPLFNGKDLQGWVAVGTTDALSLIHI